MASEFAHQKAEMDAQKQMISDLASRVGGKGRKEPQQAASWASPQ